MSRQGVPKQAPVLLSVTSVMNPEWLTRPARQQKKTMQRFINNTTGDYNIWYGKHNGHMSARPTFSPGEDRPRCVPQRDVGYTQAKENAYVCFHFASGRCVLGEKCTFRHVIPTAKDEKRLSATRDVFGRERHAEDTKDMGGNGSFSRNNRTLYVGGLTDLYPTMAENEDMLRRHFEVFGDLEYVRIIPSKSCGFVRFCFRASAEFAKVAMTDGYLDKGDEVVSVKWAFDDPNPLARQHEQRQRQLEFLNAVAEKMGSVKEDKNAPNRKRALLTMQALQRQEYPAHEDDEDDEDDDSEESIGPKMPNKKRAKGKEGSNKRAARQDGAHEGATTSLPSSSQPDNDAQQAWQNMTPLQQQQAWAMYYAQQGGMGKTNQAALQAAAKQNAKVAGTATEMAEAYYNPATKQFFRPNPSTNEAHPYATGQYRTDEDQ